MHYRINWAISHLFLKMMGAYGRIISYFSRERELPWGI